MLGALACAFAPLPADVVERTYSTAVYPLLQRAITRLSNRVPLAMLDVLLVGLTVAVVVMLIHAVREARRTRATGPLLRTFAHLAASGAVRYILFLLLWGFNYRRVLDAGAPRPRSRGAFLR